MRYLVCVKKALALLNMNSVSEQTDKQTEKQESGCGHYYTE